MIFFENDMGQANCPKMAWKDFSRLISCMSLLVIGGISSLDHFFTTMRRQFTEREWLQIKSPNDEDDQLKLFYRFWASLE